MGHQGVGVSFQAGHEERMLELYEPFIGKAAWNAFQKYGRMFSGLDLEDFKQEGRLALLSVLKGLDYGHNVNQIDGYLCTRIKGAMVDFIRELDASRSTCWRKYGESIMVGPWPEPLEHEPGTPPDVWSPVVDPFPVDDMLDLALTLSSAMRGLHNDRDRRIIFLAVLGYDNIEIAGMVGDDNGGCGSKPVGPARVSQVISASGLFRYDGEGAARKRVKSFVGRSTEFQRKRDNGNRRRP